MEIISHEFTAMASPCRFLLIGDAKAVESACIQAEQEVHRIEQKYSRYNSDSLLTQINKQAGKQAVEIDAETAGLLNYAQQCYEQSEGLFDITSGILRKVWDFKSNKLPNQAQLDHVLANIGWNLVEWDNQQIFLSKPDMELDFGGFGKEYAADRAAEVFINLGIQHGLVDLGGDIRIIGDKPDRSGWAIGIRNPNQPENAISTLILHQGAMTTSGNYERFMMVNDKRYCHILNPKTGWPINHWASVTVLASQCLVAGSLSTLAMLAEEEAQEWLQSQQIPFLAIDTQGNQFSNQ